MKKALPFLLLVPFTAFSVECMLKDGPVGFVTLALREPWGMQLLLDLMISLGFAMAWTRKDAIQRNLPWLPYVILMPILGSPAALAYLCHRALADRRVSPAAYPA